MPQIGVEVVDVWERQETVQGRVDGGVDGVVWHAAAPGATCSVDAGIRRLHNQRRRPVDLGPTDGAVGNLVVAPAHGDDQISHLSIGHGLQTSPFDQGLLHIGPGDAVGVRGFDVDSGGGVNHHPYRMGPQDVFRQWSFLLVLSGCS